MSAEVSVAAAFAEVMVYNEANKKWQPPVGTDGQVSKVEIMQNSHKHSFRIVSMRENDGKWLLNCNIHQKLKYHSATATFHQWRDEHRQVYGLNFQSEPDARMFVSIIGQAIDHLSHQILNQQSEYQQPHPADNVYQDPHQHMMHIQSAPSFHHDENQNANFRKSSQQQASTIGAANALAQQQRRASQSSNTSGGNAVFHNQDTTDSRQYWGGNNASVNINTAPTPPAISNIPAAPPAPPPMPMSAPGSSSLPPVSSNAPPPPPPPPPNFGMSANGGKATSLADQLKMRSQQLNKTTNGTSSGTTTKQPEVDKPAAPVGTGNLMSELAAQINKRKMIQAKADAVDSKSNTSNGSSDSGCGTATSTNGFSNGGSVGSATAKKWSVSDPKPTDSPKTQRKLPSASSLFAQDDGTKPVTTPIANGNMNGTPSTSVNNELLEKFRAELMVEVRLEINKAKQEIIEAIRSELGKR